MVARGFWFLVVLLITRAAVIGAGVDVIFDRATITTYETARLSVQDRDVAPSGAPPTPQVPGLRMAFLGQGTQVTAVNGAMSRTTSYNYQVAASAPGEYTIPSFTVNAQGQTFRTQPATLRVTGGDTGRLQMAFMKIIPPSRDVYVGEVFPLTIELYYVARRGEQIQHPQIKGDGFTIHERVESPPKTTTTIQNTLFEVVGFRMSASAL